MESDEFSILSTSSLYHLLYICIYIKNFAWEGQSEKVFYKCHIYASVLYVILIPQACAYIIRQSTSACDISAMYHIAHAG